MNRTDRVLLVEDDEALCALLAEEMEAAGLTVDTAATAEAARAALEAHVPALVVSDLRLPGSSGMDLLRHVRALHAPPAVIVVTAFGSIPQAVDALKAGADDFLTKPLDLDHFLLAVERSLETRRLRRKVQQLEELLGEDHFYGMIGRCRPMRVLFDHVRQVAQASGPVLITGESGTGKELVARALHAESARAGGPFLAVNCAGVPRDLLESEFFGHEKGAFTGAQERRKGLFMEAGGGTLLLDEISEMPPALQAKLLRVLQERAVRPVGGSREQHVDVRVLASTNRDLEEEVAAGRFREDLFYRLETFTLAVPPLRERGPDLDLLAARFLKRFAAQMEKPVEGFAAGALRAVQRYAWPGNVRELEHAVERAVTFCEEAHIEVEHLPRRIREQAAAPAVEGPAALLAEGEPLPPLGEVEQRYIRHVLGHVGGNKRRAAEVLGIGRRTLYRRLDEQEEDAPSADD